MMMMQNDVFTNRYFIVFIYMVDNLFMWHHPSWQQKLCGVSLHSEYHGFLLYKSNEMMTYQRDQRHGMSIRIRYRTS